MARTVPKKTKVVASADFSSFPAENNENGNVTSNYSPPPPPQEVTPRKSTRHTTHPPPHQTSPPTSDNDDCNNNTSFDNSSCTFYEIFADPERQRRCYIAMHFVSKYGGCYDTRSNPWYGKNGIISKVKRDLNMCPSTDIVYILNDVVQCRLSGTKYEGKRNEGTGAIADLKTDSIEAQIVADELEGGGSIFIAWNAVNVYRESVQKERVTKSKVYTLIQNLKPKLAKVEAHRQGSNDVESRICRARKAWCTQLAVRLGYVDYKNDVMAKEGIEGPRLLSGGYAPLIERIIQDVYAFGEQVVTIMNQDGKMIEARQGYGRRTAALYLSPSEVKKRGGKREKRKDNYDYGFEKIVRSTHPDAMDGMKMKIEASVKTYEPVKMEFQDSQQEIAGE
ncbi:MAG: hypothetical protein GY874_07965 [Desulfobacteraceae bacterium]|nr:hypothetical protein [Desulfobacteraceae bacterium]